MAGRSRTPGSRTYGRPPRPRQRLRQAEQQRARLDQAWGIASTPLERLDAVRAALLAIRAGNQADADEVDRLIDDAASDLRRLAYRIWRAREKKAEVKP